MFDITHLDSSLSNEGADLHLKNPKTGDVLVDDKGEPLILRLAGMDSSKYRVFEYGVRAARQQAAMAGKPVTPQQEDEHALNLFLTLTLGWSDNIGIDGVLLGEVNDANKRKLYTRFPWARDQANVFIGDRKNFLRDKPTS